MNDLSASDTARSLSKVLSLSRRLLHELQRTGFDTGSVPTGRFVERIAFHALKIGTWPETLKLFGAVTSTIVYPEDEQNLGDAIGRLLHRD